MVIGHCERMAVVMDMAFKQLTTDLEISIALGCTLKSGRRYIYRLKRMAHTFIGFEAEVINFHVDHEPLKIRLRIKK